MRSYLCLLVLVASPTLATAIQTSRQSTFTLTRISELSGGGGFGRVVGVRELADGRVIVADQLGVVVVIADFGTGEIDRIGGEGRGPQEYVQPDGVFALPGDSTLLADLGKGVLIAIGPDGTFGETSPIARGEVHVGGEFFTVIPRFTDVEGRVYFRQRRLGAGTATVARWDRRREDGEGVEQILTLQLGQRQEARATRRGFSRSGPILMRPEDDWAVAPNGSVAVARADGYRLEWVRPDGRVVVGPHINRSPRSPKQRDKQRWLARWVNAEVSFQLGPDGTSTIRRGPHNGMPPPDPDDFVWADEVPPFQPESMFIAPDGTAWVETVPGADGVVRYDVFDDAGQMVGPAELLPGHRVVGVGRASIFLVRIDYDGWEWLGRYGVEQP